MSVTYIRDRNYYIVKFQPRRLRIAVKITRPGEGEPVAPGKALDSLGGVDAAVNGPIFSYGSGPNNPHDYDHYTSGLLDFLHFDRAANLHVASRFPEKGCTFGVTEGGMPVVQRGGNLPSNVVTAVQCSVELVREFQDVHSDDKDPGRTWRPALALLRTGEFAFILGSGVGAETLTKKCMQLGARTAGLLDGGGSGHLAVRSQGIFGAREQRRVPSWICVGREPGAILPAAPSPVAQVPWSAIAGVIALAVGTVAVGTALGVRK